MTDPGGQIVSSAAFGADGRLLAADADNGTVYLCDVADVSGSA